MILVNGVANAMVSPMDRGLSYGDGIFRTLLLRDTQNKNWQRHYVKLAADCTRLGITCPAAILFEQDFSQFGTSEHAGVVKLTVTRGIGERGYIPQSSIMPTRIVSFTALPGYSSGCVTDGVTVRVCQLRVAHQPLLAGIKHLNRLENVLARAEWQDPDIMEGLLLDEAGHVIGGTMTNVFAVRGRQLFTPELSHSGIAGVTRERMLAFAANLGLSDKISQLSLADILDSDEVMLCNSVIGVWQVRELGQKRWQKGQYTSLFRALLESDDD